MEEMKTFDEIFTDKTKYGVKVKTSEYNKQGKYIIIDQGQSQIAGYTDREEGAFEELPAIVFGDHTRTIKYVDTPFFLGADGIKLLRSKDSNANYKYLYYALKSAKIPDTGYNRHFKWLKNIQINYPDNNKQKEIVQILDKVSDVIKNRKEELSTIDKLIKARFVEMFGDATNNNKDWETASVESVCQEILGGGTPSKAHPEYYEGGDIPWVSSKDMKADVLYDSQIRINKLGVENSAARMVPVNSVIMVIRSGILKHSLPVAINAVPLTVNQDLKAFVPGDRIITRFMATQFKMQEKKILAGVRAVTADNIEFNSLKQRLLIIPPIELQNEFVSFAEQVDKSKFTIQKSLEKTQTLFDSLMQKYFG